MQSVGKVIGVDYGDVRTGLAESDLSGTLASGICTLTEGGMRNTARRVALEAKNRGAVAIVVGLPRNMDGSEGPRAEVVRAFVALLGAETALPVHFSDERMSTMAAYRFLDGSQTYGRKRKNVIDTLSAELILQSWLDSRKRQG